MLIGCLLLAVLASLVRGNTPPLVNIDRNLVVQDDDPIGTVVTRIESQDNENDHIRYSVSAPSFGQDGSVFFTVDEYGRVKLIRSLQGKAGENFFLKVTASDGSIPISAEIRVQVRGSTSPADSYKGRHPHSGLLAALNPAMPPIVGNNHQMFNDHRKTPPVLHLPEEGLWWVSHEEEVGNVIDTVKIMTFVHSTGDSVFSISSDGLLSIDPRSGAVAVNKSLLHEVGDHLVSVMVTSEFGTSSGDMILRVDGPQDFTPPSIVLDSTSLPIDNTLDDIEHHSGNGLIAIIKNGPVPVVVDEPSNNTEVDHQTPEASHTSEFRVVVIVLPLLFTAIFSLLICCCRKNIKRTALKASKSVLNYEKKDLEMSPVSSASNTLNSGVNLPFSITRLLSRRAHENDYQEKRTVSKCLSSKGSPSLLPDVADEWEMPRHKLKFISILGEGCFGQVWKYEAQDLKDDGSGKIFVAVKTLKESAGIQERQDLIQELKVLKNLGHHPNVVSLLACCTEKEPMLVVLEYLENGKLQSYLRDRRSGTPYNNLHGISSSLSPRDLTIFALQVAKGMDYLNSHGIVHRDLAARNVLVGQDKVCKVADFGFARDIANNHVYERKSNGRLPIRWMAVESLFDNIFSSKTDVWSFGILLWEIVTLGSTPYPGIGAEEVMKKIKGGYRLEKPDYCKREMYNIMYYCWYEDANDRPSFKELIRHLEDLIVSEVDYIEINNFPERCYYNINTTAASGELI